ncbi:hypothetical protein Sgly_0779 [Syntrophobotulus glycolicus DSM 8271]|uniref:Uncharacterized protein n=1 Tax=Syntrophobotulus glycolicus (strain DSM 8271 / FlGlyR) TaxID=645991 RepID=F0T172_SYNGF|nr:hypothetical protein [Syntrophobotulus glycolicus]ADY55136.1 hypothetical protein Sgly_0779 [Syntrophobotulus glycolicus DSM 8271]
MENRIFGPLTLPSGKEIKFREPLGIDRSSVMQFVNISEDNIINNALLIDEYVSAKCITEIDGAPTTGEYKTLFDNWKSSDILFYKRVYEKCVGIGTDLQEEADKAADFLLKN